MSQKFKYSIENFRGVAILFVMLSHLSSLRSLSGVGDAMYFFVVEATTWFVFISGYLFFRVEKGRFNYPDYLVKKAKYVLLPYLFFSLPAICAGLLFLQNVLRGMSPVSYTVWSLLVGGSVFGPMWFIPMIGLFFLVSPIFYWIGNSKLIGPATIFGTAIALFSARPIENLNPVLSFIHFFGFYLLGMAVSATAEKIENVKNSAMASITIAAGLAGFVALVFVARGAPDQESGFWQGLGVFNFAICGKLCLLVTFYLIFERYLNNKNRIFGYLAEVSFGLFFLHGFYKLVFIKLSQRVEFPNPFVTFVVELAIVVGASIVTVYLLKLLLKKQSRYVIGC